MRGKDQKQSLENATVVNRRKNQLKRKRWLAVLGCAVVLMTALALMVPAISITKDVAEQTEGIDLQTAPGADDLESVESPAPEADAPAPEQPAPEADAPAPEQPAASEPSDNSGDQGSASSDAADSGDSSSTAASDKKSDSSAAADKGDSKDAADKDDKDKADKKPAQEFKGELLDGEGNVVLTVAVKAPKGAFPEGTAMETKLISADDVQSKVEEAIERKTGEEAKVKSITAVDIVFKDKDGKEIEPAKDIEVKITSNEILDLENPVLVHVLDKAKKSSEGNPYDAEIVAGVKIVNEDDNDFTEGTENTMKFKTNAFSPYVIVGLEDELALDDASDYVFTAVDEDAGYTVTVTIPSEADIPDGAVLQVEELQEPSSAWTDYVEMVEAEVDGEVEYARLFDVNLLDGEDPIQPDVPIDVQIALNDTSDMPEAVQVVDMEDNAVNTLENELEGDAVKFQADEFSVYGIVGTKTLEANLLAADGKTLKVTVTFDEKAMIPDNAELVVKEITEEDEEWFERSVRLADELSKKYGNVTLSDARFLSISIMVDGEEFEPKAPVQVKIAYEEALNNADTAESVTDELTGETIEPVERDNELAVIHYTNEGAEFIESDSVSGDEGIIETTYKVDGFSDYDIVYEYVYDTYEAGDDYIPSNGFHTADIVNVAATADAKAAGEGLRGVGEVPVHSKTLTDNNNGTYTIGLNVTGDADTDGGTASNANVIIIYDTSTSMVAPGTNNNAERNNYIPMATGGRGIDTSGNNVTTYSDGVYFQLYRRNDGTNRYTALTDDNYSGTVYRRTGSNWQGYTYTEYRGQRYSYNIDRADASEKVVYDFTNALFSYQNQDNPTNIQAAFITFDGSAVNQTNGWTSNKSDITGKVSSTGNANSAKLSYHNYTNWTDALTMAENLINSSSTDDDPTYVVFITDGRPQTSAQSDALPNYNSSKVIARRIEEACDSTGGAFYGIFAFANSDDWLAALLSYAYNGTDPANPGTTFDTEGYYKASDTAALTQAINEIFSKIVQTLGVTDVQIADGTTNTVVTGAGVAHLLEVDEGSYQYWLSFPVTAGSGGSYTLTMVDLRTATPVNYTVEESGGNVTITWTDPVDNSSKTATYSGKINAGNTLTIEWIEKTPFYNYNPPTASFNSTTSSVDWNLAPVGTLLDGVQYTVTFDCYPSQETLDMIADLKNGDLQYSELDPAIRQYLDSDYKLKTNTTATLSYTDTRPGGGSNAVEYVNPEPQPVTATESLAVSKTWSNTLDEQSGWKSAVDLFVKRDGGEVHKVTLNSDNNWSAESFISYGIITIDSSDNVSLKTTGHDYSFSEEAHVGHNWELKADTVHPMLINNEITSLRLIDAADAPDAITGAPADQARATVGDNTYYKLTIDDEVKYYVVDSGSIELTATNHRRSYLDVTKAVTPTSAPADDKFDFTMTMNIANADAYDISDVNLDGWVWFSIWDTNAGGLLKDPDAVTADVIRWQLNNDDVSTTKPSASDFNGYFCVPSGTPIKVGMKSTYSLRFLNLPEGSTYTIAESETMPAEGYSFVSIVGTRSYDEDQDPETTGDWKTDPAGTASGQTITGTIEFAESAYKVEVTNKWATIDVKLEKDDEKGEKLSGSTFNLLRHKDNAWVLVKDDIKPGAAAEGETPAVPNPVDLGGLGIGWYKLTETDSPDGYVILSKDVYFAVYKENGALKACLTNEEGGHIEGTTYDPAAISEAGSADDRVYTIKISNTPGKELPNTGGPGTAALTVIGVAMIAVAAIMLITRRRPAAARSGAQGRPSLKRGGR